MQLFRKTGEQINLTGRLGGGGESIGVFAVEKYTDLAAKVYKLPDAEKLSKLHIMCASPPGDPTATQGHISICWPIEVLYDSHNRGVGFLIKKANLAQSVVLAKAYHPSDRRMTLPGFTWKYLLQTAANIASATNALHRKGYVLGDINDCNILVKRTALVTFVDCDSMQVPNPGSRSVFRCPVGRIEFTAPEVQDCDPSTVDRTTAQDNFALGVVFFLLLMEGVHPYAGILSNGADLSLKERIRFGHSPYSDRSKVRPMPVAPSFEILSPNLQALFRRCFTNGVPQGRPSAAEWKETLDAASHSLAVCKSYSEHIYSSHLSHCPWCFRVAKLGGFDSFRKETFFPAKQQPQRGHQRDSIGRVVAMAASHSSVGMAVKTSGQPAISTQPPVRLSQTPAVPVRPPIPFSHLIVSAILWLISFLIWNWYFTLNNTHIVTQAGDTQRSNATPVAYLFGIPVIATAIILLSIFVSRVVANRMVGITTRRAHTAALLAGLVFFVVATVATVSVLVKAGNSEDVSPSGGVTLTPPPLLKRPSPPSKPPKTRPSVSNSSMPNSTTISAEPPQTSRGDTLFGLTVESIRLYPSDFDFNIPPKSVRSYSSRYQRSSIRYINWELTLHVPVRNSDYKFDITELWHGPNGSLLVRQSTTATIPAGFSTAWVSHGFGSQNGGVFQPGIYVVELVMSDSYIAKHSFIVDDDLPSGAALSPAVDTETLQTPIQLSPPDRSTFDYYPRNIIVRWSAVRNAVAYTVEFDCMGCCGGNWCADVSESQSFTGYPSHLSVQGTECRFEFVGAQPGRWRVWAVSKSGKQGPKSPWREFRFLQ